jgi:predicted dinucleotide-binding enzyme
MKIGIIGSGNMGCSLAQLLVKQGHSVQLGTRRVADIQKWIETEQLKLRVGSYSEVVQYAAVLFLATSWPKTQETLLKLSGLSGKILIDCTNPEDPEANYEHALGFSTSGSEQVAQWAPGARVVKAFNHLYGSMLLKGTDFNGVQASVYTCGDDDEAKAVVASLAQDLGLEPIDVGGLHRARLLEPLGSLIVRLASQPANQGADIAFKLLTR